jgi:hypothetical protein
MCATVFRANDGQTQNPSIFIPAYLSEQSQFIELVRQHMDFLPPKSRNRMVNAIEKPLNVLFGELYPHLLDIENRSYICLTGDHTLPIRQQQGQH